MRRAAWIAAAAIAAPLAWTLMASFAFAFLGRVPFHCWFYYAVPWPEDFWWDGSCLLFSGALASLPFALVGRFLFDRSRRNQEVYGKTEWASRRQMKAGSISASRKPF